MPDPTISAPDYASLTHPQTGSGGTSFWNDAITQHMLGPEGGPQINPFASADQPTREDAWNKDPITQSVLDQTPPAKTNPPIPDSPDYLLVNKNTAPVSQPEAAVQTPSAAVSTSTERSTPSFSHMARDLAGPFEAPSESPSRSYSVAGPQSTSTQSDFGNKLLGALGKGAYVLANMIQGGAYGRAGINKPTYAEQQNEREQALTLQARQQAQERAMVGIQQEAQSKMAFVQAQAQAQLSQATLPQDITRIKAEMESAIQQIQADRDAKLSLIPAQTGQAVATQSEGGPQSFYGLAGAGGGK